MANFPARDGANASVEIKARGTGTGGDPYVIEQDQNLRVGGTEVSATNPLPVRTIAQPAATANTATAAANTAVTITYAAAGAGNCHAIDGVLASLSADPATAVSLTVQDGANTVVQVQLTRGGAAPIDFPIRGTANTSMTITLAAAGAGIVGMLNAKNKRVVI